MEFGALAPLLIANPAVFAPAAALVAARRRRAPLAWFAFGIVLGPIALGLVLAAPPRRCPACDGPTAGWLPRCPACGADVRSGAMPDEPEPESAPPPRAARSSNRRRAAGSTLAIGRPASPAARRRRDMARPIAVGPGRPTIVPPDPGSVIADAPPDGATPGIAPTPVARAIDGTTGLVPLATGVYAGGSVGLEIGHRYTIARDPSALVITGPVETTPTAVAHRRELATIDPVGVDDRLVITGVGDGRGKYLLRFQAVAGMSPELVEQRLAEGLPQPVGSAAANRTQGG